MSGITDDCLIEITDLDLNLARCICQRSQISDVTIAADPNGRTAGKSTVLLTFKPFIELDGIAADIAVRRPRHFEISELGKACGTRIRPRESFWFCHFRPSSPHRS